MPNGPCGEYTPSGFSVHRVLRLSGHTIWRGGAPLPLTLHALMDNSRMRCTVVTLIDLRHPVVVDDESGRDGRLSPDDEYVLARKMNLGGYIRTRSDDPFLTDCIDERFPRGDVYPHCMYGFDRTGFAVGRYARRHRVDLGREGPCVSDWHRGWHFEAALRGNLD